MKLEESRRASEENNKLELMRLELELNRSEARDTLESSLTTRTSRCLNALQNIIGEFPRDPAAMPGYFHYLENQFESYQVKDDIKAKVLQAHLNGKARTIVSRLNLTQLDDYQEIKRVLLKDFRSVLFLWRERFLNRKRQPGESCSQVASDLHTSLSYYLRSRNIEEDYHKLMSL